MSFPTQLLEGYRHAVLSLTNDQAKLVVFVGNDGIESLARELGRRCPAAALFRIAPTHYTLEHSAFRGEITKCGLFPGTALLEVRAPDLDLRNALNTLPSRSRHHDHRQEHRRGCGGFQSDALRGRRRVGRAGSRPRGGQRRRVDGESGPRGPRAGRVAAVA